MQSLKQTLGNQRSTFNSSFSRKNPNDFPLGLDKLPPQARDLEESVLGGLLLDRNAVAEVVDILKPESFYVEGHQYIFEAIQDLFAKAQPIDLLTVTEALRKMSKLEIVGGVHYIAQLAARVGSTASVEYHARIIAEKYIMRELISSSNEVIKHAYEDSTDVLQLLDYAEQRLFSIAEQNLRRSVENISSLVAKVIKSQEEGLEHQDGLTGVPTGYLALDRLTSGWQRSDLIIIAARPAMGKTALVLNMARNAAVDFNRPIAIFSLEMSAEQLATRLIAAETGITSDRFKRRDLKGHEIVELAAKVDRLAEAPIFIDDTPAINIFELRAKCRRLKMQHDIQMVIIDYLQLMSGTGDQRNMNREQEISTISRSLKSIAKELNIPVIALSQLSRAVETRAGDKRPQLSDLRESGAIEQDADIVSFLYRPEYYQITQDADGNSTIGITEIIIAKHRNGALDTVKLQFVAQNAKFIDLDAADMGNYAPLTPLNDLIMDGSSGIVTMPSRNWDNSDLSNLPKNDDVPF